MPEVEYKGKKYRIDEAGWMEDPNEWTPDFAEYLAKNYASVKELTPDHWKVINFIRNYYLQNGEVAPIRKLVKATGFSLREIYGLFPTGPQKGAAKVAGVPKSAGCV